MKVGITGTNNSGLKTAVTEEINLEINKIYFWCDSKMVVNYIHNEHFNFGVYVAHRINEVTRKLVKKIALLVNWNKFHLTWKEQTMLLGVSVSISLVAIQDGFLYLIFCLTQT